MIGKSPMQLPPGLSVCVVIEDVSLHLYQRSGTVVSNTLFHYLSRLHSRGGALAGYSKRRLLMWSSLLSLHLQIWLSVSSSRACMLSLKVLAV